MSDQIKVEVVLDLADLHHYVAYSNGDPDDGPQYADHPVTITDAVVGAASTRIVEQALTDEVKQDLRNRVRTIQDEVIREHVTTQILDALAKPIRRTNDWGDPVGKETSLGELIDAEIKKQLVVGGDRYNNKASVIDQFVSKAVAAQLQQDLAKAFQTARDAMLRAAQDAGAQALRAAVTKAVGA